MPGPSRDDHSWLLLGALNGCVLLSSSLLKAVPPYFPQKPKSFVQLSVRFSQIAPFESHATHVWLSLGMK